MSLAMPVFSGNSPPSRINLRHAFIDTSSFITIRIYAAANILTGIATGGCDESNEKRDRFISQVRWAAAMHIGKHRLVQSRVMGVIWEQPLLPA